MDLNLYYQDEGIFWFRLFTNTNKMKKLKIRISISENFENAILQRSEKNKRLEVKVAAPFQR